jgi:hypothetical protein
LQAFQPSDDDGTVTTGMQLGTKQQYEQRLPEYMMFGFTCFVTEISALAVLGTVTKFEFGEYKRNI